MGLKKGDARRGELLAASEKLFYTKGYENTSVQDIMDAVGFSKGGFYHHFDSKLAVLEAICQSVDDASRMLSFSLAVRLG